MSGRARHAGVVVAMVMLAIAGCAGVRSEARASALTAAVQRFGNLLRWGETDSLLAMLRHPDGAAVRAHPERLAGVRVTRVVIGDSQVDDEATHATVRVRLAYYREADGVLRAQAVTQHWWFSPGERRWYLDGDLPDLAGTGVPR